MFLSSALRRAAAAAVLFAGSSPLCLMGNSYNDSFVARGGGGGVSGLKLTTKKTQTISIRTALSSIFRRSTSIRARINPTDESTELTEPVAVTESKRSWWKVEKMMKSGFFESNHDCKACLAKQMLRVSFGEYKRKRRSFVNAMFTIILTYVTKYRSSTTHSESSNVELEDGKTLSQHVNDLVQGLIDAYTDEAELIKAFYSGEVKLIVDLVLTRNIFTSIEEWKTAIEFLYLSRSTAELRAAYGAHEIDAPWKNLRDVNTGWELPYARIVRNVFELVKHWKDEWNTKLSVDTWLKLVRVLNEDVSWGARVDIARLKGRIDRCRNEAGGKAEEISNEEGADGKAEEISETHLDDSGEELIEEFKCGSDEWVEELIRVYTLNMLNSRHMLSRGLTGQVGG